MFNGKSQRHYRFSTLVRGLLLFFSGTFLGWAAGSPFCQFAHAGSEFQLIDDLVITEESKCAAITVAFNYPVRYDRHLPLKTGDFVRIKIRFLGVRGEDQESLQQHEAVMPPPNKIAALSEVNYEGDVLGGPFLNLFFSKKMAFKVRESKKNRGITIFVSDIGDESSCVPEGDL